VKSERKCVLCWTEDHRSLRAVRSIDGDDLCRAHIITEGHELTDGEEIIQPEHADRTIVTRVIGGRKVRAIAPAAPESSEVKEADMRDELKTRECGAVGLGIPCDTRISERCKSGFCPKHFHLSKRKTDKPVRKPARRASNGANGGLVAGGGEPSITLSLTEEALNVLILRLPLHERQTMLSNHLHTYRA
jgi:hypothetical protein